MSDQADNAARRGVRRAQRPARSFTLRRPVGSPPGGGSRALRSDRRRVRGLPGTLGMTLLGAVAPGSGYLYAGRRALGALVLLAWIALLGGIAWYFGRDLRTAIDFALDPTRLKIAAVLFGVGVAIWSFVVFTSYRLVRPRVRPRAHTIAGNLVVGILCLTAVVPATYASRYAVAQADLVETVFQDNVSATTPEGVTKEDPWGGLDRVNVLLLGGDGGEGRTGVRTDTVILVSMNTTTGKTVMFSLPRNMMYAEFPEGSPLHDLYPEGYGSGGTEDPGFYMLNAIYGQVPERHPGVLGKSDNEGADAIKQAVEGSLGIPVDYYLLVNLAGFREIVDAMGGVTVNINEPVAIEGNTDAGIPPVGYLEPGPSQHLDGYHALWFARGRYGSDDYARMDRQRCMVDALVEAANPTNLLRRYLDLAEAGKDIVTTDIPLDLAPAFVELALEVKGAKVRSVVFKASEQFFSGDPDYDYVRSVVEKAIQPKKREPGAPRPSTDVEETTDACAYAPTGETVSATE
ncbi:LCP family protein [Nocardioides sp.]|uniref:LCP family protein n=1 Tax=Nocardioides sp. TaxID=35761 RepID=UPI00286B2445|nr:LCP family protein [Nocardioides sp.]